MEHLIGSDGQFSLTVLLINAPFALRISILCLPFVILQICWIWQKQIRAITAQYVDVQCTEGLRQQGSASPCNGFMRDS